MRLVALLIRLGAPPRYAKAILVIVGLIALVGALWGLKALYDHRVVADHEAKIERQATKANEQAADERVNDALAGAKHEQELHDVIAAQPDQPIAPTSRALACKRLRDAGRNPPACR